MIRIVFISLFCINTLFAATSIVLKQGWEFVGFPNDIEKMEAFNQPAVDIVWGYDAVSQTWLGFSPNKETQAKLHDKGYKNLQHIAAWQGVWIHNKKDWTLTLQETSNDANISLQEGWNLLSLPADMTISPTLFKDDIVWSYHKKGWLLAQNDHTTSPIAPPLSKIDSAEAFWVKSSKAHTLLLSQDASSLHTFNNKKAMEEYITKMVIESYKPRFYAYDINYALEAGGSNGASVDTIYESPSAQKAAGASNATGTNLQEDDVDESDILKHDGTHIFFYDRAKNMVHISDFHAVATNQKTTIAPIILPQNIFVQAMYLNGHELIMISNEQRYYYAQKVGIVTDFLPQKTEDVRFELTFYDISDINHIKQVAKTTIDGTYQNSRIVDDKLYLISQFSPKVHVSYPKIEVTHKKCTDTDDQKYTYEEGGYIPECQENLRENGKRYRYDYSHPNVTITQLIPTLNKGQQDLISHDTFYAPHKLNQFPTMTVISKFDLQTNAFTQSVSTAGQTNTLYASSKNIYLTSVQYPYYYDFRNNALREVIYKFSIGDDFDFKAKGFVEGTLLNQYSLSEKGDVLRVATTSGAGWRSATQNTIFTLKADGDRLNILGKLTGLGKKGERIKSARFINDKGYVVTFLQTDPLYTIDLSDDAHPKKVGELSIPGFSSYIHPVDDNYILTLGRNASADGRQAEFIVQLFDVSTFSNPQRSDIVHFSSTQHGFDAEYNPQAFIYRKSDKRFAITYREAGFSMLDNYQIDTRTGKFIQGAQLSHQNNAYENRGIIFNLNNQIVSALFSANTISSTTIGAAQ